MSAGASHKRRGGRLGLVFSLNDHPLCHHFIVFDERKAARSAGNFKIALSGPLCDFPTCLGTALLVTGDQ